MHGQPHTRFTLFVLQRNIIFHNRLTVPLITLKCPTVISKYLLIDFTFSIRILSILSTHFIRRINKNVLSVLYNLICISNHVFLKLSMWHMCIGVLLTVHLSIFIVLLTVHLSIFIVLLTVHLSIFISVINQLDAQNFCFTVSLFHASICFEHMFSSSGGQNCITLPLVSSHWTSESSKITKIQFYIYRIVF